MAGKTASARLSYIDRPVLPIIDEVFQKWMNLDSEVNKKYSITNLIIIKQFQQFQPIAV